MINNFSRTKYRLWIALVAVSTGVFADQRSDWNQPQPPFRIYGNSFFVGPHGLGSILITSPQGHILIDGALPESAEPIANNIRALGYRVEDIKLILNSHVHFDHAGGIAELQKLSGALVAASASTAKVLISGTSGTDDPQFGGLPPIQKVATVKVFRDKETLRVGDLKLTAHLTPGHTPGGTSWTWQSCEQQQCLNMVYADSLNPISAPAFHFTHNKQNPRAVADFEKSIATVAQLPCDILITPHPELAGVFVKLAKRERGEANAFVDRNACINYAAMYKEKLRQRIAEEAAAVGK